MLRLYKQGVSWLLGCPTYFTGGSDVNATGTSKHEMLPRSKLSQVFFFKSENEVVHEHNIQYEAKTHILYSTVKN